MKEKKKKDYPVAVVKNNKITAAVREAVSQVGLPVVKGKLVLIKPNCNSPDEYPGTTNPAVVAEVVRLCEKGGAGEIVVADKSSVFWPHYSTRRVMKVIGLSKAISATSAKLMSFDEGKFVQVGPAEHWPKGFKIPEIVNRAEVIISIPVIHTHGMTGVSLSLKNSVGLLDAKSRLKMHASRSLQEKVAEINLFYKVDLVVLDGTRVFISGGPNRGEMLGPNVVVVSPSRVQADITAYDLLVKWGAALPQPAVEHPQIAHAIKIGIR